MNQVSRLPVDGLAAIEEVSAREQISALADASLSPDKAQAAIDLLLGSAGLRQYWTELHAVGDALRSEHADPVGDGDFMSAFSARLAAEPTVLAPRHRLGSRRGMLLRHGLPAVAVVAATAMVAFIAFPLMHRAPAEAVASATPVAASTAIPSNSPEVGDYVQAHQQFSPAIHAQGPVESTALTTVRVDDKRSH